MADTPQAALPDNPSTEHSPAPVRNRHTLLLAAALVAVMAFEILARLTDWAAAHHVAHAAMALVALLSASRFGMREYYLLVLCSLLTVWLFLAHPDPGSALDLALDQAAFLMAFVLLLGLLHENR